MWGAQRAPPRVEETDDWYELFQKEAGKVRWLMGKDPSEETQVGSLDYRLQRLDTPDHRRENTLPKLLLPQKSDKISVKKREVDEKLIPIQEQKNR